MRRFLAPALLALGLAPTVSAQSAPRLDLEDCELPRYQRSTRCGTLTVLENPADPEGRKISLDLVVLPAKDGSYRPDAVFYLVGGPGSAATDSVRFLSDSLNYMQKTHDVVLVDQRGTGESNSLACELTLQEGLDATFGGKISESTLRSCLKTLDADPAFYTTPAAADDLEAVRVALGYQQMNLVGMSYGTRLALVYARRYPERARTLALRGVNSPASNILLDVPRASEQAMAKLLQRCEDDSKCAGAFPRLRAQLTSLLEGLGKKTVEIELKGSDDPLLVSRDLVAGALRTALYGDRTASWIPYLVDRVERQEWSSLASFLGAGSGSSATGLNLGLYLSIVCAEDVAFLDAETAGAVGKVLLQPSMIDNFIAACGVWPAAILSADYKAPVSSQVPTLLMSGADDPATSAETAEEIARFLPNHEHLVTPGLGHYPTWTNCFALNTGLLIEAGSTEGLDLSCAGDYKTAGFKLPPPWNQIALGSSLFVGVGVALVLARRRARQARQ